MKSKLEILPNMQLRAPKLKKLQFQMLILGGGAQI